MRIEVIYILFFTLCIGARSLLALLPFYLSEYQNKIFAFILAIISIGFMSIYVAGFFKENGVIVAGGKISGEKNIWWNHLRPIHSVFYMIAAYFSFKGQKKKASTILFFDLLFGIISFIMHHFVL